MTLYTYLTVSIGWPIAALAYCGTIGSLTMFSKSEEWNDAIRAMAFAITATLLLLLPFVN